MEEFFIIKHLKGFWCVLLHHKASERFQFGPLDRLETSDLWKQTSVTSAAPGTDSCRRWFSVTWPMTKKRIII